MKLSSSNQQSLVLSSLLPKRPVAQSAGSPLSYHSLGGTVGSAAAAAPTTTPPISTADQDEDWNRTTTFSGGTHSKTSLQTTERLPEVSSTLFQYFCLLCRYHGAAHVPAFWATLLAGPPPSTTFVPSPSSSAASKGTESVSEELLVSRATTLDFTACYVGPNTLLALADLCRVRRVTLVKRHPSHHHHPAPAGHTRKASAVVVQAVAPLWSSRLPAPDDATEMCSLLPHLRALRMVRLSLHFSNFAEGEQSTSSGSRALLSLLEALQGHPCLELLDLSFNPVAAALLPALSRLVQTTPTLTCVPLENTLLVESEQAVVAAQCLLNRLRRERQSKKAQPASPRSSSPLSIGQPSPPTQSKIYAAWVAQTLSEVRGALEAGVVALPRLLGKPTPYVCNYKTQQGTTTAATRVGIDSMSSTSPGALPTRHGGAARGASNATLDTVAAASSSLSLLPDTYRPSTGIAFLCYDGADPAATFMVAAAASARESESAPRLGTVWTPECTEVVRVAFLDRQAARQHVLGGRTVWPNVPLPEDAAGVGGAAVWSGGSSSHKDKGNAATAVQRPTAEAISSSHLLRGIRHELLPPPQAPPGMSHDADAAFLTTAEENYWTTVQTQDRQWGYLAKRLVEHLEPVLVYPGTALYTDGEAQSHHLYFIPKDEAEKANACVSLQAGGETCRVLPGQWVGAAEPLGCSLLYPSAAEATATSTPSPFARHSTARLVAADDTSPSTAAVTLWALPVPVAFFYLFAPYQLVQQHVLQRSPMSVFAHIHPVHRASLPVQLETFHFTRTANATTTAAAATGAARGAAAPPVFCTAPLLNKHLVLLQEGEYLLRVPPTAVAARTGVEAHEHHLLSGTAVVTQAAMDLDAEVRAGGADGEGGAEGGRDSHGALSAEVRRGVGKAAALRQYRLRKAESAEAAAQEPRDDAAASFSSAAAAAGGAAGSKGKTRPTSAAVAAVIRQGAVLRPYPSHAPIAHWRYATLSNTAFAAMSPSLRLALTRHCCVIPGDE